MRGQVKIQQKRLAARRRRRIRFLILYSVAAAGLLLSALSYISQLPSLSIASIEVRGNSRLSSSSVEAIVLSDLAQNYMGLFSKRNILLYPSAKIEQDILSLPLVQTVRVTRSPMTNLVVSVTERSEVARFCTGEDNSTRDCYSVDEKGFIFAPISHASCAISGVCAVSATTSPSLSSFIYRHSQTDKDDLVGDQVTNPTEFKKLTFFIHELAGLSVEPREAIMSNATSTGGYVTIVLEQGGKLILNTSDDLSLVLDNIATVISDKTLVPSLSDFLAKLDYMKLDAGNKIVYKMRK